MRIPFRFTSPGLVAGLTATLLISPAFAQNCVPVPGGLVSWWRAERNALDSADGNHGTLIGDATYTPGHTGASFLLDGNRDGVRVGLATNLQLQSFSIEAWIKRTSPTIISFNGNGGAEIFALGAGGGGFGFYLRPDARLALGKLQVNEASTAASITDTNWHHVAVTKSNTVVVFYVDGVAFPAAPYNSGGFTYSGPGFIGAWLNPSGLVDNSFYGRIDELGFYNRALTATEITAIYNAGAAGKCPAANQPPQAHTQTLTLPEDTTITITLTGSDPEGDLLTFQLLSSPAHGSLQGTPPILTYEPARNYFGPDRFTFRVNDGQTDSQSATIHLVVQPVNDAPVAVILVSPLTQFFELTNDVVLAALCGDAMVVLDGSLSNDVENDPLTFAWSDGTNHLGTARVFTNQLAAGTHDLNLVVHDGQLAGSSTRTIEVITPAQAVGIIIAAVQASGLTPRQQRPLLATLNAAVASLERCNARSGANQLGAFQNQLAAQVAPFQPHLAQTLHHAAQQVIDTLPGRVATPPAPPRR